MAKAYVFPGQGAQFVGMGKDLYESNPKAKALFDKANEVSSYCQVILFSIIVVYNENLISLGLFIP